MCKTSKNPSSQKTGKGPAGARLGSKRQSFHPESDNSSQDKSFFVNKIRREELADQRQAASIFRSKKKHFEAAGSSPKEIKELPGRGVCLCGWTQLADQPSGLWRIKRKDRYHAFLRGIQPCGLRWVCPICTKKKGEADKQDVNDGLAAARAKEGLWPVMLTLTTRHSRREDAEVVLGGIIAAEQRIKRLTPWEELRVVGYARVLEWTHGKSGHHPHFHTILLISAESEKAAIARVKTLQPCYMRQLERAGRDGTSPAAWKRSFQVQGAAAAENYITKWGLAEELTGAVVKDSMTPWRLLRLSRTAEDESERRKAAALWWEIMVAVKGKSQLFKSEGWKNLVEEWRAEQPDPEPAPEPEEVQDFGVRASRSDPTPAWELSRTKTLAIREAAEAHEELSQAQAAVRSAIDLGPTDTELIEGEPDDVELIDDADDFGPAWAPAAAPPAPPDRPGTMAERLAVIFEAKRQAREGGLAAAAMAAVRQTDQKEGMT